MRSGIKHSDLQRAIHTYKCKVNMALKYQHVKAHQDAIKPWWMLTLEEQLNVICDKLAKEAVLRYLSDATPEGRGAQLLPLEKVAIVVNGEKLTTDVGQEVRNALGHKEGWKFYTGIIKMKGSTNTGGLGWSEYQFEQEIDRQCTAEQAGHVSNLACKTMHLSVHHEIPNGPYSRYFGQRKPQLQAGARKESPFEQMPGSWQDSSIHRKHCKSGTLDA